ncbi:MAG: tetratricopeptide repeat protein [Bacteriovoracia bacterium]
MESIVQIRQMMAEQKFAEVQLLIEVQLSLNSDSRHELLLLYLEALDSQDKSMPTLLALELAELESQLKHHEMVLKLISSIRNEKYFQRLSKLRIKAAEDKGKMDQLYSLISEFYIHQYEKQIPSIPVWVSELTQKYYKNDFNLKLKELAITLLLKDLKKSETIVKELLISCVEKSSPRGLKEKIEAVADVLQSTEGKGPLEIYQNFCLLSTLGITEKTDYKKIIEMIIYFEDFKFQVLTLNLLHSLNLSEEAVQYSSSVRENKEYNFVYLDKYFTELKPYFVEVRARKDNQVQAQVPTPDLTLTDDYKQEIFNSFQEIEEYDEEKNFLHMLKYQTYTSDQLCDLAVSFLQSDMPRVALKASELAISSAANDIEYLKGCYLKLTCLLQTGDYRAALDTSLQALEKAKSRDDVLSFLYGQAEAHIRLNQKREAKRILAKVLSIDSEYRMAKERLEKL